jgi:hypothetical protein
MKIDIKVSFLRWLLSPSSGQARQNTLKMETAKISERLVSIYQPTWYHIQG